MGECFFWYWPTQAVPDKELLNSCVCVSSIYDIAKLLVNVLTLYKNVCYCIPLKLRFGGGLLEVWGPDLQNILVTTILR